MAWNEPGGKRRDPWQSGGGGGGGGNEPDFDAMLRRLRERFGRIGGGGGSIILIVIALLAVWVLFDSVRQIDQAKSGVVLRFGKFNRLMPAGLNFKWPSPIEQVLEVETTRVRSVEDEGVRMLTQDENIVLLNFNVQYAVSDPRDFLFQMRSAPDALKQAAESAVREVVGATTMDVLLSGERSALALKAREGLQVTLDSYRAGIAVTEFNFQNVRPPDQVKEAFDDAITAREDKQRFENNAEAYRSKVVPEAGGEAARIRALAEGEKSANIALAEGEARRFELLATQYAAAPALTRKRILIETMQDVLTHSTKILVEGEGDKVIYLPMTQGMAGDATVLPKVTSDGGTQQAAQNAAAMQAVRDRQTNDRQERDQ